MTQKGDEFMFSWMRNLGRGWLYTGFLVITLLPMLYPMAFPVEVTPTTRGMHGAIETLRPGDVVLYSAEFSADMSAELFPGYVAVFEHIMQMPGVKVVLMATSTDGPMFNQKLLETANLGDRKYGEDVVHLGFLPGGESALAAFCQDVHKTFPQDYNGTPVSQLPLMEKVRKATDLALIINDSAGGLGPLGWIRQAHTTYGVKVATILGQDLALSALPYVESNQLAGLLAGLRGAAEYEKLMGFVGRGTAGMGAQSWAAMYFLAILLVANIGYFGTKHEANKRAAGPGTCDNGGVPL